MCTVSLILKSQYSKAKVKVAGCVKDKTFGYAIQNTETRKELIKI